ncbi:MAG: B12-binding domain-containing radical SAM protein [Methanosarcinales archaeon]
MDKQDKLRTNQYKNRKSIMLIGIAGTSKDFLLSLHALKCFLYQDNYIKNNTEIILKQYYYIASNILMKKCEEILNDINKVKPDLLGFSCYVWNIDAIKYISDRTKQRNNNIEIILGGPEIAREDIINGKFDTFKVDFLIFGEGEKPFQGLLRAIIESNSKTLQNIKGLAYRRDHSFFCNKESDIIENLEKVPSPYLEGYVSEEILSRKGIRANIETQRGCNFNCAYCYYHKNFHNIRYKNADIVIKEINFVFKKGIKAGRILDANFLSNKDFAKKIVRGLIENKIKMSLVFEILPQFIDDEIAELFGRYIRISPENRVVAGIGIQTINQEALRVIRRKIPVRYFDRAFNLLQKQNVLIKSDIILGLPRETKKTYFATIEYITEKMRYGTNYLSLAHLRILPGTDLVEIAKKEYLKIDKRNNAHFVYSTQDLPREDMLECLRINTVAFRLLSSLDIRNRMKIRDMFFDVKDTLHVTNIELLQYFKKEFFEFLKDRDVDYVKDDFPNAELYYENKVHSDVPDGWIINKLVALKKIGL